MIGVRVNQNLFQNKFEKNERFTHYFHIADHLSCLNCSIFNILAPKYETDNRFGCF